MTIAELLPSAAAALARSGVPEHFREANSIMQFAIGRDRVFLIAHPEYELSHRERQRFDELLLRRTSREPLQYITGRQEFFGLDFLVTPDVLIPRPETEMLVAKSIDLLGPSAGRFAEIGVGSGCISISILSRLPEARAVGADVSTAALGVAAENAERHGVGERLELIESDLLSRADRRRFDLIVSNPPYVPAADMDGLQPEVRDFEPALALTDGGDGLSIVKRIIAEAPVHLRAGGYLVMEIGFDQAAVVEASFDRDVWREVAVLPDFQAISRMAVARLNY